MPRKLRFLERKQQNLYSLTYERNVLAWEIVKEFKVSKSSLMGLSLSRLKVLREELKTEKKT